SPVRVGPKYWCSPTTASGRYFWLLLCRRQANSLLHRAVVQLNREMMHGVVRALDQCAQWICRRHLPYSVPQPAQVAQRRTERLPHSLRLPGLDLLAHDRLMWQALTASRRFPCLPSYMTVARVFGRPGKELGIPFTKESAMRIVVVPFAGLLTLAG